MQKHRVVNCRCEKKSQWEKVVMRICRSGNLSGEKLSGGMLSWWDNVRVRSCRLRNWRMRNCRVRNCRLESVVWENVVVRNCRMRNCHETVSFSAFRAWLPTKNNFNSRPAQIKIKIHGPQLFKFSLGGIVTSLSDLTGMSLKNLT